MTGQFGDFLPENPTTGTKWFLWFEDQQIVNGTLLIH